MQNGGNFIHTSILTIFSQLLLLLLTLLMLLSLLLALLLLILLLLLLLVLLSLALLMSLLLFFRLVVAFAVIAAVFVFVVCTIIWCIFVVALTNANENLFLLPPLEGTFLDTSVLTINLSYGQVDNALLWGHLKDGSIWMKNIARKTSKKSWILLYDQDSAW